MPVPEALLTPIRYPDEFNWRSDDGEQYLRPKVIVSGVRNPDIPWRLKVLPDPQGGVIPRDSMCVVIPHEATESQAFAFCALLGSSVASCWVDTLNTGRSITVDILRTMPVPPAGPFWERLADRGRRIVELAERDALMAEELRETDRMVIAGYGLPEGAFQALAEHFAGVPAPEDGIRYPTRPRAQPRDSAEAAESVVRTFGTVLEVAEGRLKVWMSGLTPEEGEWIPVPPAFPGSQLRAGATFDVEVPGRDLLRARFSYQSECDLDLPDLLISSGIPA